MNLFQLGTFKLHSGQGSRYKIDCDALSLEDWRALAYIASEILLPLGDVESVPTGGDKFAQALMSHRTCECGAFYWHHLAYEKVCCKYQGFRPIKRLLIADDVLTTGNSMEIVRAGRDAIGCVVFARNKCPDWIRPIFQMSDKYAA